MEADVSRISRNLRSSVIKDRETGLDEVDNVSNAEVIDALFSVVVTEKSAAIRKASSSAFLRLRRAVQAISRVTDVTVYDMPEGTAKAIIDHVVQIMPSLLDLGHDKWNQLAVPYIRTLQSILSRGAEHLSRKSLKTLLNYVLSLLVPGQEELVDGAIKASRPMGSVQVELGYLLELILLIDSAAASKLMHEMRSDLILSLVLIIELYQVETTGLIPVLRAFNKVWLEQCVNMVEVLRSPSKNDQGDESTQPLQGIARRALKSMVHLWPTRQFEMKEQAMIAVRLMVAYLSSDDMIELLKAIRLEQQNRLGTGGLTIDLLALKYPVKGQTQIDAFNLRTYQLDVQADKHGALSCLFLNICADAWSRLPTFEKLVESPYPQGKRRKVEKPYDLLADLQDTSTNTRLAALRTTSLLLEIAKESNSVISRHFLQSIPNILLTILSDLDAEVQEWAHLTASSLICCLLRLSIKVDLAEAPVILWKVAMRNLSSSRLCRAASGLLSWLLFAVLSNSDMMKELEPVISNDFPVISALLAQNGLPVVCDSACHFISLYSKFAGQSPILDSANFSALILRYWSSRWSANTASGSHLPAYAVTNLVCAGIGFTPSTFDSPVFSRPPGRLFSIELTRNRLAPVESWLLESELPVHSSNPQTIGGDSKNQLDINSEALGMVYEHIKIMSRDLIMQMNTTNKRLEELIDCLKIVVTLLVILKAVPLGANSEAAMRSVASCLQEVGKVVSTRDVAFDELHQIFGLFVPLIGGFNDSGNARNALHDSILEALQLFGRIGRQFLEEDFIHSVHSNPSPNGADKDDDDLYSTHAQDAFVHAGRKESLSSRLTDAKVVPQVTVWCLSLGSGGVKRLTELYRTVPMSSLLIVAKEIHPYLASALPLIPEIVFIKFIERYGEEILNDKNYQKSDAARSVVIDLLDLLLPAYSPFVLDTLLQQRVKAVCWFFVNNILSHTSSWRLTEQFAMYIIRFLEHGNLQARWKAEDGLEKDGNLALKIPLHTLLKLFEDSDVRVRFSLAWNVMPRIFALSSPTEYNNFVSIYLGIFEAVGCEELADVSSYEAMATRIVTFGAMMICCPPRQDALLFNLLELGIYPQYLPKLKVVLQHVASKLGLTDAKQVWQRFSPFVVKAWLENGEPTYTWAQFPILAVGYATFTEWITASLEDLVVCLLTEDHPDSLEDMARAVGKPLAKILQACFPATIANVLPLTVDPSKKRRTGQEVDLQQHQVAERCLHYLQENEHITKEEYDRLWSVTLDDILGSMLLTISDHPTQLSKTTKQLLSSSPQVIKAYNMLVAWSGPTARATIAWTYSTSERSQEQIIRTIQTLQVRSQPIAWTAGRVFRVLELFFHRYATIGSKVHRLAYARCLRFLVALLLSQSNSVKAKGGFSVVYAYLLHRLIPIIRNTEDDSIVQDEFLAIQVFSLTRSFEHCYDPVANYSLDSDNPLSEIMPAAIRLTLEQMSVRMKGLTLAAIRQESSLQHLAEMWDAFLSLMNDLCMTGSRNTAPFQDVPYLTESFQLELRLKLQNDPEGLDGAIQRLQTSNVSNFSAESFQHDLKSIASDAKLRELQVSELRSFYARLLQLSKERPDSNIIPSLGRCLGAVYPFMKDVSAANESSETSRAESLGTEETILKRLAGMLFSSDLIISSTAADALQAFSSRSKFKLSKRRALSEFVFLFQSSLQRPNRSVDSVFRRGSCGTNVSPTRSEARQLSEFVSSLCIESGEDGPYRTLVTMTNMSSDFAKFIAPLIAYQRLLQDTDGAVAFRLTDFMQSVFLPFRPHGQIPNFVQMTTAVDILIHLLQNPKKGDRSIEDWLSMDFYRAAESALHLNRPMTALFLIEHLSDHTDYKQDERRLQTLLLDIHERMDEPDGFYGVDQRYFPDYIRRRLTHEQDWGQLITFESAQPKGSHQDRLVSTTSLAQSMANLGMYGLSGSYLVELFKDPLFQTPSLVDVSYDVHWKLHEWSLPDDVKPFSPNRAVYGILRAFDGEILGTSAHARVESIFRSTIREIADVDLEDAKRLRNLLRVLTVAQAADHLKGGIRFGTAMFPRALVDDAMINLQHINANDASASDTILPAYINMGETLAALQQRKDGTLYFDTLVLGSQTARKKNALQQALRYSTLLLDCTQGQVGASRIVAELNHASVLWRMQDQSSALHILDTAFGHANESSSCTSYIPIILAKSGKWKASMRSMSTTDLIRKCFEPAAEALTTEISGDEAGRVHQRFAAFCDARYREEVDSEEFKRAAEMIDRLKDEEKRLREELDFLSQEIRMSKSSTSKAATEKSILTTRQRRVAKELSNDTVQYQIMENTQQSLRRLAIHQYLAALSVTNRYDVDTTRLITLWLQASDDANLNVGIAKRIEKVPSYKFIFLLYQLSARLTTVDDAFQSNLKLLLMRCLEEHPHHTFIQIWALQRTPGSKTDTSQRDNAARDLITRFSDRQYVEAAERLYMAYDQICCAKFTKAESSALHSIAKPLPKEWTLRKVHQLKMIPVPTMHLPVDPTGNYKDATYVQRFEDAFTLANGISRPRILLCIGSDGRTYKQIAKGGDDARQDAIMLQLFEIVNRLFARNSITRHRNMTIRTYKVIPLSPQTGIIEFVDKTQPLQPWLVKAHERYRPMDWLPHDCQHQMRVLEHKYKGKSPPRPPADKLLKNYLRITEHIHPVMRHFFREISSTPTGWYAKRLAYARTVASSSILGHVIGLGDRHGGNILLDDSSGEVIHIDFGHVFDSAQHLAIPETVPFRLTRDMVDGFGLTGVEGVFRRCCEHTLRVLREESMRIQTVLEVLRHDPLYLWSVSPAKLARKGGEGDEASSGTSVATTATGQNETNAAARALRMVEMRLSARLSVEATVNELIQQATDPNNLSMLFFGWQPYL